MHSTHSLDNEIQQKKNVGDAAAATQTMTHATRAPSPEELPPREREVFAPSMNRRNSPQLPTPIAPAHTQSKHTCVHRPSRPTLSPTSSCTKPSKCAPVFMYAKATARPIGRPAGCDASPGRDIRSNVCEANIAQINTSRSDIAQPPVATSGSRSPVSMSYVGSGAALGRIGPQQQRHQRRRARRRRRARVVSLWRARRATASELSPGASPLSCGSKASLSLSESLKDSSSPVSSSPPSPKPR